MDKWWMGAVRCALNRSVSNNLCNVAQTSISENREHKIHFHSARFFHITHASAVNGESTTWIRRRCRFICQAVVVLHHCRVFDDTRCIIDAKSILTEYQTHSSHQLFRIAIRSVLFGWAVADEQIVMAFGWNTCVADYYNFVTLKALGLRFAFSLFICSTLNVFANFFSLPVASPHATKLKMMNCTCSWRWYGREGRNEPFLME